MPRARERKHFVLGSLVRVLGINGRQLVLVLTSEVYPMWVQIAQDMLRAQALLPLSCKVLISPVCHNWGPCFLCGNMGHFKNSCPMWIQLRAQPANSSNNRPVHVGPYPFGTDNCNGACILLTYMKYKHTWCV